MKVELLYFQGCPNYEALGSRLPRLIAQAGVDSSLELLAVESDADAQRLRFLGSPSLRVDGRDVEPGADQRADYGLKCRLYRTPGGVAGKPSDDLIASALRRSGSGQ